MNNLSIRLPEEMVARLETVAAKNGMKPTAFVRFALAQLLNAEAAQAPLEVPPRHTPAARPGAPLADQQHPAAA